MRYVRYESDVMRGDWRRRRRVPDVPVEPGMVVEEAGSDFVGEIVAVVKGVVTLEDRHGRRRDFPMTPAGFRLDGQAVTLTGSLTRGTGPTRPTRTASGSIAVPDAPARVARASRIWVEGVHDADLIERVWGDDLRIAGVVVEPIGGVDDLAGLVRDFAPEPTRRLGVLVDHLVDGSKESRLVAAVTDPNTLVTGHPYVDIWQAVKPASVGITAWPSVPPGEPWKDGVCRALGVSDPAEMWRRIRRSVSSYTDLEVPLLGAVERLIDFVTT